jgi:hypothetical protein
MLGHSIVSQHFMEPEVSIPNSAVHSYVSCYVLKICIFRDVTPNSPELYLLAVLRCFLNRRILIP